MSSEDVRMTSDISASLLMPKKRRIMMRGVLLILVRYRFRESIV